MYFRQMDLSTCQKTMLDYVLYFARLARCQKKHAANKDFHLSHLSLLYCYRVFMHKLPFYCIHIIIYTTKSSVGKLFAHYS